MEGNKIWDVTIRASRYLDKDFLKNWVRGSLWPILWCHKTFIFWAESYEK